MLTLWMRPLHGRKVRQQKSCVGVVDEFLHRSFRKAQIRYDKDCHSVALHPALPRLGRSAVHARFFALAPPPTCPPLPTARSDVTQDFHTHPPRTPILEVPAKKTVVNAMDQVACFLFSPGVLSHRQYLMNAPRVRLATTVKGQPFGTEEYASRVRPNCLVNSPSSHISCQGAAT